MPRATPSPAGERPGPATDARRGAIRDFKRQTILNAAREIFASQGLEGATLRAIAQAAGYTPGAVYAYYPTKEAIYADILAGSLLALRIAVEAAGTAASSDEMRVRRMIRAFFDYYRAHPQELDLGFYLFQGLRPRGLTPDLDRMLNSRLIAVLLKIRHALVRLGRLTSEAAHRETVATMCHIAGVLLMANTGRLKTLDSSPEPLIDHYIDTLVQRLKLNSWDGYQAARTTPEIKL
ncbi:MAG TPA: TetR/AcrR family transcriptional regulator [Alphaproteobacteria bacterium]